MPYAKHHLKQKQRERTIRRRKYFREYQREHYKYILLSPEEYIGRRKEFGESRMGEKNPCYGRTGTKHPMFGKRGEGTPMFGKKNPVRAELNRQQTGKNHPNYINGRGNEPYTSEFNKQLKELIRSRDDYKCQKCGCPEIENNRRLNIHHIDYKKDNCIPSNLISLCFKCNIAVNNNRPYWTKYFKKKIKRIINSNKIQLNFRFNNSVKRK